MHPTPRGANLAAYVVGHGQCWSPPTLGDLVGGVGLRPAGRSRLRLVASTSAGSLRVDLVAELGPLAQVLDGDRLPILHEVIAGQLKGSGDPPHEVDGWPLVLVASQHA